MSYMRSGDLLAFVGYFYVHTKTLEVQSAAFERRPMKRRLIMRRI